MLGLRFIKAPPTTYLMQMRGGKVVREGAGLAGFYYGPTTSLVAVPVNSRDVSFIFQHTARDFQTVTVQGQIAYRVSDPKKAAHMLDFALKADGKTYASDDPDKLPQRVLNAAQVLSQQAITAMSLREALQATEQVGEAMLAGLSSRPDIAALGIEILGLSILAIRPTPDTARALEAEAREAILRSADEAIFSRRNAAVEQERAIRESELDTEIAVEMKQRAIRETQMDAEASVVAKQNALRETRMVADIALEERRKGFVGLNAENTRTLADAEAYRVGALMKMLDGVDPRVVQALTATGMGPAQLIAQAFGGLAENAEKIGQLNLSPDLLQTLLEQPKAQAESVKAGGRNGR